MFSHAKVTQLLGSLVEHTRAGRLWVKSPDTGPRLDFFSAMEPAAHRLLDEGFGPGGDPVWMGAMLDQGWPEWLVMMMLSLTYAKVGAADGAFDGVPEDLRSDFRGSAEDAAAFAFVRACVAALHTDAGADALRRRYSLHRLRGGAFSVLACLRARGESEALTALERLADSLDASDEMDRETQRQWRARLRELPESEVPPAFARYASSLLRIDDYTPLGSLDWPKWSEEAAWAPRWEQLVQACRESLVTVLQRR